MNSARPLCFAVLAVVGGCTKTPLWTQFHGDGANAGYASVRSQTDLGIPKRVFVGDVATSSPVLAQGGKIYVATLQGAVVGVTTAGQIFANKVVEVGATIVAAPALAKTSLKNARQERFDFLGYSFGPHRYKANGHCYLSASPSKKSVQRLKTKVGNLLVPGNNDPWPEVRDTLNSSLFGWSNYFCHGTRRSAFRGIDRYVYERVRDFLARRHKVAGLAHTSSLSTLSMDNTVCGVSNAYP